MANRFKKMIQPLLDEARREGYKAGHEQGMKDGFQKKTLAYENEIKFLKVLVERLRAKPIVPGPEMADPNIMEHFAEWLVSATITLYIIFLLGEHKKWWREYDG